jgi:hypothetical protein
LFWGEDHNFNYNERCDKMQETSMIPLLLITKSRENAEVFINELIAKEDFSPHYVFKLEPAKTEYTIDQIRLIKSEIMMADSHKRLFILYSFENSSAEAQNAFLKTLEESGNNQFILVVSLLERILPTIQSRSRIIKMTEKGILEIRPELQKILEGIPQSGYGFLSDPLITGITHDNALILLDEVVMYLKGYMVKPGVTEIMRKAMEVKSLIQNNNANPQLSIDSFFIFYKKKINQ